MKEVKPKVFFVASTQLDFCGVQAYLEHIGVPNWRKEQKGHSSDSELLIEIMGRLCYRSFAPGMNPNVKKVREGNQGYLKNIIKSGHGSVLEHSSVSFIFADVSRVFTHELVRHRVGTAMSQESLRFVRLQDLSFWSPRCLTDNKEANELVEEIVGILENTQKDLADILDLDNMDFGRKKQLTSAMRRVAPIGLATTIGWSANFRTLRHVIEMRTSPHAEEEIRFVFDNVAEICYINWPNIFQDFTYELVDGYRHWKPETSKI